MPGTTAGAPAATVNGTPWLADLDEGHDNAGPATVAAPEIIPPPVQSAEPEIIPAAAQPGNPESPAAVQAAEPWQTRADAVPPDWPTGASWDADAPVAVGRDAGGTWRGPQTADSSNGLTQVSCASASFCMAVDSQGGTAMYDGTQWTSGSAPSQAVAVSCPAAGYCIAADNAGGVISYQNGSWSKVTKIDGNNTFVSVSCPSSSACLAADSNDNVLYYTGTATSH